MSLCTIRKRVSKAGDDIYTTCHEHTNAFGSFREDICRRERGIPQSIILTFHIARYSPLLIY